MTAYVPLFLNEIVSKHNAEGLSEPHYNSNRLMFSSDAYALMGFISKYPY